MKKNTVGKNLCSLRKKKGLSQEELAARFHVTRQTISNWESGKSQIELDILIALAEFFAVPIEALIYDTPPQQGEREENVMADICRAFAKLIFFVGAVFGLLTIHNFLFAVIVWLCALFAGIVLFGIAEIITLLEQKE